MFFKINGACSLGDLKFSSSCSLGINNSRSENRKITAKGSGFMPQRPGSTTQHVVTWLSAQLDHTCQAVSKGATWIKNTWQSCSSQAIYKDAKPKHSSPTDRKAAASFEKTMAEPTTPVDHSQKFTQATITFAHELCAKLAASQPAGKSFAISPVSLLAALGMCLNIIQKEKQALFIEKIGLGQLSVDEANVVIGTALKRLVLPKSFKDGSIEIAQTLAARTGVEFDAQFLNLLKEVYGSELLVSDDLKTLVNKWVDQKTHGKIKQVLSGDSSGIVFALVNAVYLNLSWKKKFVKPEQGWQVQQFLCADNKTAPVSMMSQKGNYLFCESETFSMMEVPYKAPDGRQLSQLIFLPKPHCSLEKLEASMNADMLRQCRRAAEKVYGIYWEMPKVNTESSFELVEVLKSMDIPLAYIDSTKCSNDVDIKNVIHKTVVSNSEEGTQAAAVTVICAPESAMPTADPKTFIVDRAYAYLIMDKDTVLFRGRVSDASSLTVDQ